LTHAGVALAVRSSQAAANAPAENTTAPRGTPASVVVKVFPASTPRLRTSGGDADAGDVGGDLGQGQLHAALPSAASRRRPPAMNGREAEQQTGRERRHPPQTNEARADVAEHGFLLVPIAKAVTDDRLIPAFGPPQRRLRATDVKRSIACKRRRKRVLCGAMTSSLALRRAPAPAPARSVFAAA